MTQAQRYIENVLSGAELACEYVRLAVLRHLADLERQGEEAFPYWFDERQANRVLDFFACLKHTSGKYAGKHFNLQDNQAFILSVLFGWRHKEGGGRRFTQAYLEMARKAGKSELAAGIELYAAGFEGEEGAQVYTAATTREQADMVFRAAKKMTRYMRQDSPTWRRGFEILANAVVHHPTDSFIKKVSADAGTLDGLNPHCAVIDEYHAHKTDAVKGVMQTGMGSRENPLLLIITTAGFDKDAPCYKVERANAVAVLKSERNQENLFAIIFTLDEGDDWQDEKVWRKANPNLGSTPTVQYLREQVQDAINKGASTRVQVLTKNFNVWMDAPQIWLPEEQIKACMRPIGLEEFGGRPVYMGLDLAYRKDSTALALFSPGTDGQKSLLKVFYWVPEGAIVARSNDTAYPEWVSKGYMYPTPGGTFDANFVRAKILEFQRDYGVRSVAYDPWNAYETALFLQENGIDAKECRPSPANLNEPIGIIEDLVIGGKIEIDENPVFLWNCRNVVFDRNADDSRKPNKKKSSEKIDGLSATFTAVAGWLTEEAAPSSYLLSQEFEKALE